MNKDIQEILEQIEKLPNGNRMFAGSVEYEGYGQTRIDTGPTTITTDDLHKLVNHVREVEAEKNRLQGRLDWGMGNDDL